MSTWLRARGWGGLAYLAIVALVVGGLGWVIAPHCRAGAARQNGVPFLWVTKLTKPGQVGAH